MLKDKIGYINKEYFEGKTGISLEDAGFDITFQDAVFTASENINAFCGNTIESIGLENLSENQRIAVQKATTLLVKHYLKTGDTDLQRGAASMNMGLVSFSYASP